MAGKIDAVLQYWKKEYSNEINKYTAFKALEQFEQVGDLFAPGNSYFYILNFHNLQFEFISPGVSEFVKIPREELKMENLLGLALPSEVDLLVKKEAVIKDFFIHHLSREERTAYKVLYTYRLKDAKGKKRIMLHQATPLTLTAEGAVQHIFSLHSDISHLRTTSTRDVSFLHIKGGRSFCNVRTGSGKFASKTPENQEKNLGQLLSGREKEIIHELALGASAEQIAEKLHLSVHTIRTHKKNILQKSGCKNTTELVAKCLTGGVISPSF